MTAEANTCQHGSLRRQVCPGSGRGRSGISLTSYRPKVLVIKARKCKATCEKEVTAWVTLPNTWGKKGATYVTCGLSGKSDHSVAKRSEPRRPNTQLPTCGRGHAGVYTHPTLTRLHLTRGSSTSAQRACPTASGQLGRAQQVTPELLPAVLTFQVPAATRTGLKFVNSDWRSGIQDGSLWGAQKGHLCLHPKPHAFPPHPRNTARLHTQKGR